MTAAPATLRSLLREAYDCNDRSVLAPGFQAVAVHGFSNWAKRQPMPWRLPFRLLGRVAYVLVRNVYGIELPSPVRLGRRFKVAHQGGIVVHPHTVFGDDCVIRQNVTIGAARDDRFDDDHPTFGDRVEIGAGAAVVGKVRIGDDVRIGPNAVVLTNVRAGSIVVSPAPRIMGSRTAAPRPEARA